MKTGEEREKTKKKVKWELDKPSRKASSQFFSNQGAVISSYQKSNDMDFEKLKKLVVSHGKTETVSIRLDGTVPGRRLYWWWKLDSGGIWFTVTRSTEEKADPDDHMCWPRFELYTESVPEWNEVEQ